jgi:hypothetical protein
LGKLIILKYIVSTLVGSKWSQGDCLEKNCNTTHMEGGEGASRQRGLKQKEGCKEEAEGKWFFGLSSGA